MNVNPLQSDLDNLGQTIGTTFGMLFQIDAHLNDYSKVLIKRFEDKPVGPEYCLLASTLIIGDLTGNSDNGWKINFPTDYSFEMKLGEVNEKVKTLINQEAMRSIAFSYEILEKYIFDVTAKFLFLNKNKYQQLIEKKLNPSEESIDSYLEAIRNLRGKNNKKVISLIRTISVHYKNAEKENNEGINLSEWYEVFSRVRHGIIHSNYNVLKDKKRPFNKDQKRILNIYFPNKESESKFSLEIQKENANKILILVTEFALLIFKSLSIEGAYNWKIYRDMDGPKIYRT